MTSKTALVIYASTHGHTGRIAERIAADLRDAGVHATVTDIRDVGDVDPAAHDLVVLGGSIHAGTHQPALVDWISHHRRVLKRDRTAVFSVSLAAADDTDEAHDTAQGYLDDLLDAGGIAPVLATCFAGALQYREYGFPTRLLIRLIARHHGMPTDPHMDVDLTDWDAVDAFAVRAAELARTHAHA
jgi:menaquinone-dependent protoporphyrinogen oxidase